MAKSKNWYSKYKIRTKSKPKEKHSFLCNLSNGSIFSIPSIDYEGILLQVSEGGCYVVRKNAPKYSKMGELLGTEDRKEYKARTTEVYDRGEITDRHKYFKRRKKARNNSVNSVGTRKNKRTLQMARK